MTIDDKIRDEKLQNDINRQVEKTSASSSGNIDKFGKSREEVTKFYNDYFKVVDKDAYASKYKKCLRILTPKQMLQRLPIALPQVKAGNKSENLLNVTSQIIYSLHREKEITEKVHNNIMKPINL